MRCLLILSGLLASAAWAAAPTTEFAPCSCIWDNSTKNYPPNSRTSGLFNTTVRYECGYICLDESGRPHAVNGAHSVSFAGSETGDEVVCDGLRYESQPNPSGSFGRWSLSVWDGVTRPIDARQSSSPALRDWAAASCGQAPSPRPSAEAFVDSLRINEWRVQVGLKPVRLHGTAPDRAIPAALDARFAALCSPDDRQSAFLRGNSPSELCERESARQLGERFENLRARAFRLKDPGEIAEAMSLTEDLLLCPAYATPPTPAIQRILLDQFVKYAAPNPSLREAARSLSCTMAWRGLTWAMLTPATQKMLSVKAPAPDEQ
ncbi:MAG: hypothetical protein KF802_11245 [Bdellovibrionaceae bacterium]|nr:hypothetical protein [Pseudobdellovibrionaceae bacterium]